MMKSTRTLTCQICGRGIRGVVTRKGSTVIAHHGYRRPFGRGFQTSSCEGARELPYEVSRGIILDVVAKRRRQVENAQAAFDALETYPPADLTERDVTYRTPRTYTRPVGFTAATARAHVLDLTPEGKPLRVNLYGLLWSNRRFDLGQEIRWLAANIDDLQKRYDDWTPAPSDPA
jgi:hypothetical protein